MVQYLSLDSLDGLTSTNISPAFHSPKPGTSGVPRVQHFRDASPRGWNELVDSAALALDQLGKSHATTWATQMKKAAPAPRFAIDPACCGFHGKNPDGNSCDPRMVFHGVIKKGYNIENNMVFNWLLINTTYINICKIPEV